MDLPAPLPEVDWATAAHELSKIIVPSNRQTTSYRAEDLNAEASRIRKERQIAAADQGQATTPAVVDEIKTQLRTRKLRPSRSNTPRKETSNSVALRSSRKPAIDAAGSVNASSSVDEPPVSAGRRESSPSWTPAGSPVQENSAGAAVDNGSHIISSRPGSASSAKSSTPTTTARRAAPTRTTAPRQSKSPKKVPPVPKVPKINPKSGLSLASPTGKAKSPSVSQGNDENKVPQSDNTGTHDVNGLSAGIQKLSIKLKVPSREENAAREKERRSAAEQRRTESPQLVHGKGSNAPDFKSVWSDARPVSAPGGAHVPPPLTTASDVHPETQEASSKSRDHESPLSPLTAAPAASLPASSGSVAETKAAEAHTVVGGDTSSSAVAPQGLSTTISSPATPGAAENTSPPQRSVFSPPVSTSQTRHGIPVLTSSSPIPFASPQ